MAALNGPILFNSGSGSDTLASGLGPATAINDSTESTTVSYSGTTITFSGATDLSGVTAGDLMYIATSTGRKLFEISSVNDGADTLVVHEAPTGTTSGLSWAIGGKRATLGADSGVMWGADGAEVDWILQLESGYTESFSSSVSITAGASTGFITIRAESGAATKPILTMTGTGTMFAFQGGAEYYRWKSIAFENTNASPGACFSSNDSAQDMFVFDDCSWSNSTNEFSSAVNTTGDGKWVMLNCDIIGCDSHGFVINDGNVSCYFDGCKVMDNGGDGIRVNNCATDGATVRNCWVHNNTSNGVHMVGADWLDMNNCVLDGNGGDGLHVDRITTVKNNIFSNNTAYGIDIGGSANNALAGMLDYNCFHSNTSGHRNNADVGDNDITANPFYVDRTNDDFTLMDGSPCADVGFPEQIGCLT